MRKFLLLILIFMLSAMNAFAAKIPEDVRNYLKQEIPNVDIRFDGVIIFPSNTLYLPLYPSLFSDIKSLNIKQTFPANTPLRYEPDVVIFNNDFVLLKVLSDGEGKRTVAHLNEPPIEVRTGLLPQDMLVPSGLIVPENIKSIIGNLKIATKNEDVIRVENEDSYEEFISKAEPLSARSVVFALQNKMLYVTTNFSKNIQVVKPGKNVPEYSLSQKSIPVDVKAVNDGKFLLVTSYDRPFVDVVSVADSRFIKQIALGSNPEQILLDVPNNKAYVASPSASTIYVIDLNTMSLTQKIKINGYCEHILLTDNKIFYVDKLHNEIWSIELDNGYELKDVGNLPNISAIAFADNKLFVASRTKSRIAIIDYDTFGLVSEFTTSSKPTSMLLYNDKLYVLGAQSNEIQIIDVKNNSIAGSIALGSIGFSSKIKLIDDYGHALVTDLKNNQYSIVDLNSDVLLDSYYLSIPLKDVVVADSVRLFN